MIAAPAMPEYDANGVRRHLPSHPFSQAMFERSGQRADQSILVSFLYTLIRDEVTPGRIETILEPILADGGGDCTYSNGWLLDYCIDVAARLTTDDPQSAMDFEYNPDA